MVKLQLNVKRVQIPVFYSMADLQKGDKVRSIIKVKIEEFFFFLGERIEKSSRKHSQ